jgi:hypothetical protein
MYREGAQGYVMKEPTYSVFVRFRRGQRLTLKRSAPLDVALRFASEVRSERFHNPDDVFIIDDASGDTVTEASFTANGVVVQTVSEPPPTSDVHESVPGQKDELETLLTYVGRWQLRHAQLTLRGGQRLTSTVERSLSQLVRLMEYMLRSKLLDQDVEKILHDTSQVIEQVRKVREGLQQAEKKLQDMPSQEAAAPPAAPTQLSVPSPEPPQPQARKKQARGKG